MPHDRKRHLYHSFSNLIRHAKIVGVFGHRQVGKTTFLEAHSRGYISLDDHEHLDRARKMPKLFLNAMKGDHSAIDECQLAPPLFPALKLAVHRNKKPGQFILSGSVRFTSRKAIKESLTGRISGLELYPLTVTEIDGVLFTGRIIGLELLSFSITESHSLPLSSVDDYALSKNPLDVVMIFLRWLNLWPMCLKVSCF